jgi:preprotein translocase subunit SecE
VKIFGSIRTFFIDVQGEFKRVTWPTREATLQSTGVVLVVTLTIAAFLGLVDLGLSEAIKLVIR